MVPCPCHEAMALVLNIYCSPVELEGGLERLVVRRETATTEAPLSSCRGASAMRKVRTKQSVVGKPIYVFVFGGSDDVQRRNATLELTNADP